MADKELKTEEKAEKKPATKKASAPKAEGIEKATAPKKTTAAKKPAAEKTDATEKTTAPKKVETAEKPVAAKKAATPKTADTKTGGGSARSRLKAKYKEEIIPQLMKERGYVNVMEVPNINKIVLNMRIGDIKDNSKSIALAVQELESITGQKCIVTKAKNSIANFKLRENQSIGIKCTLRGERMYEFFDKLVSIALPRVRDFRGISSKSFDGRGNYSLGIKEQLIFPEISYEKVEKVRGFDISIVTTAKSDDEARLLLAKLGMPFRN